MGGPDAVFINLAALAGPRQDRPDAMMAVNYRAPLAAARVRGAQLRPLDPILHAGGEGGARGSGAVQPLESHGGLLLARLERLPVSVFTLGLLYCKTQGVVGQRGDKLNMVDLTLARHPHHGERQSAPATPRGGRRGFEDRVRGAHGTPPGGRCSPSEREADTTGRGRRSTAGGSTRGARTRRRSRDDDDARADAEFCGAQRQKTQPRVRGLSKLRDGAQCGESRESEPSVRVPAAQ